MLIVQHRLSNLKQADQEDFAVNIVDEVGGMIVSTEMKALRKHFITALAPVAIKNFQAMGKRIENIAVMIAT